MRRTYYGKNLEITILPSGKDQSDTGMFVELDHNNWKSTLFIPDSGIARVVGRELYYSLVCEFYPNDFQTRPNTPEPGMVYRRVRRRSSSSRLRKTPQEFGVEAEPYDKTIVDSVEQSSNNADIGEARLRVERTIFQSIQTQECDFTSAEKLWWDIKFNIALVIVCLKNSLLKLPPGNVELTFGEIFDSWRKHSGFDSNEMYFSRDGSLTQLGQTIMDVISKQGIIYRLLSHANSRGLNVDMLTVQNTNPLPEVDGNMALSLDQTRILQVVLVVILFMVLVVGIGSFITENRKMMDMLKRIQEKCKS
jgi:hypothetical protein